MEHDLKAIRHYGNKAISRKGFGFIQRDCFANACNDSRSALPSRQLGFTLAEILIVLTIIGVMAVMTIPSLIQNANEQQKIALFKKGYNAVVNAYATEFAVKTPPDKFSSDGSNQEGGIKIFNGLVKQLNVKYYLVQNESGYEKKFDNPSSESSLHLDWIITEDGIGYNVTCRAGSISNSCTDKLQLNSSESTIFANNNYSCTKIRIDIDGPEKGPNKICGYDDLGITSKDDIKNLPKCDQIWLFQTKEGITAGNPDTMIAAKIIEQN